MLKWLIGWILSKIFPLNNEKLFSQSLTDWESAKAKEMEDHHGGHTWLSKD